MAVRQGDLATVKSFVSKRADVVTIKDNQGVNIQCVLGYLDLDSLDPGYLDKSENHIISVYVLAITMEVQI